MERVVSFACILHFLILRIKPAKPVQIIQSITSKLKNANLARLNIHFSMAIIVITVQDSNIGINQLNHVIVVRPGQHSLHKGINANAS